MDLKEKSYSEKCEEGWDDGQRFFFFITHVVGLIIIPLLILAIASWYSYYKS